MKRTNILFAAIIGLISTTVQAAPTLPNFDLGIKAGANFAKLDGKSWDAGYKASFLGGVFLGLRFPKVGVQVEGLFSQTKYTTSGVEFYNVYKAAPGVVFNPLVDSAKHHNFNVSYFNIPVLLEIKLLPILWVQLGPQYSGIVSINDKDNFVKDSKSLFKSGDFSGVVGLEAKLPFHLVVGARYVLGFSSMNNTNVSGAWQQRVIQAHVGFSFL